MKNTTEINCDQIIVPPEVVEDSVENFFTFIESCELEKDKLLYKKLKFLVKNNEDVKEWFNQYNGDIDAIQVTTRKMQVSRMHNIDLNALISNHELTLKDKLEMLFQEECSPKLVDFLRTKLHSGELTFQSIYEINTK